MIHWPEFVLLMYTHSTKVGFAWNKANLLEYELYNNSQLVGVAPHELTGSFT